MTSADSKGFQPIQSVVRKMSILLHKFSRHPANVGQHHKETFSTTMLKRGYLGLIAALTSNVISVHAQGTFPPPIFQGVKLVGYMRSDIKRQGRDGAASYISAVPGADLASFVAANLGITPLNLVSDLSDITDSAPVRTDLELLALLGITRAQIAITTIPFSIRRFETLDGAPWVRGSHSGPRAIQDAGGQWWEIDLSGGIINVGWFGAVGDGVTDDVAAINSAITALNKGTVILPKADGRYKISSTIKMKTGVKLLGASRKTKIEPTAQTFAAITAAGAVTEWSIENVSISYEVATGKKRASNAAASAIRVVKSGASYPYFFSIKNVSLSYAYNGFYVEDLSFMYSLADVYITEVGGYGIDIAGTVGTTVNLSNVYVNGSAVGGFNIRRVNGLTMSQCASDRVDVGSDINYFESTRGVINGFDAEVNNIGNFRAIIKISGGELAIYNFRGFSNTFSEGTDSESYGIYASSGAQVMLVSPSNNSEIHSGGGIAAYVVGTSDVGQFIIIGPQISAPIGGSTKGIETRGNNITLWKDHSLSIPGRLGVGTATPQVKLDVVGPIRPNGYTVATLPKGYIGAMVYVTDQMNSCPPKGSTFMAGGNTACLAFYNGTDWVSP